MHVWLASADLGTHRRQRFHRVVARGNEWRNNNWQVVHVESIQRRLVRVEGIRRRAQLTIAGASRSTSDDSRTALAYLCARQ